MSGGLEDDSSSDPGVPDAEEPDSTREAAERRGDRDDLRGPWALGPEPGRTIRDELESLRADLEAFEEDVEERTVHRSEIESDLERYVRARLRRGHARGWGPYLVLLYGTAMTIGAFYFLAGGWAILAMLVVWLSTLGLYALMLLVGLGLSLLSLPGRGMEKVRDLRR